MFFLFVLIMKCSTEYRINIDFRALTEVIFEYL